MLFNFILSYFVGEYNINTWRCCYFWGGAGGEIDFMSLASTALLRLVV